MGMIQIPEESETDKCPDRGESDQSTAIKSLPGPPEAGDKQDDRRTTPACPSTPVA